MSNFEKESALHRSTRWTDYNKRPVTHPEVFDPDNANKDHGKSYANNFEVFSKIKPFASDKDWKKWLGIQDDQ